MLWWKYMDDYWNYIKKLLETEDGTTVVNTINALTKKVDESNRKMILNALMCYAESGRVVFHQGHAIAQAGYSYNPCTDAKIEDWNSNYIVIANRYGDPFCLDFLQENSPVYFALHGEGKWEFDVVFESFQQFLKALCQTGKRIDALPCWHALGTVLEYRRGCDACQ